MEQTIKNMELILVNVNKELTLNNYSSSKTLMNTYKTLCDRFLRMSPSSKDIGKHIENLNKQQAVLEATFKTVENLIHEKLLKRKYKEADTLTETNRRIENVKRDLLHLNERRREYSRNILKRDQDEVRKVLGENALGETVYEEK